MAFVRIQGVYRDGRGGADDGQKLFIVCQLEENGHIAEGSWPGVMDDEGRTLPLLLTISDAGSELHFSDETCHETNFCKKPVRLGEFFTVGEDWVYEIYSCHQFGPAEMGARMAKVEAICIDKKRAESYEFMLWCFLDKLEQIMPGRYLGYCADDGFKYAIEVNIDDANTVEYGGGNQELTSLSSGRVGDKFTITSTDDSGEPDVYTYKIISASFC